MAYSSLQIRTLSFHGPTKASAVVDFQSGLNVIYGASDTGKSFIVESIDFMLGGKGPLPDIPQSKGYDRVMLAITFSDGDEITLSRSKAGGQFQMFKGLHRDVPDEDSAALADVHSERDEANLSAFLLNKIGLSGKRIRKNARDETQALSFRNLARLAIVNEEEIIQKRSPLSDGNYTADTANTSVFTLLLEGTDDRPLTPRAKDAIQTQRRIAQIELLDQLIGSAKKKISDLSNSKEDLADQETKLNDTLAIRAKQLALTEDKFKTISKDRRDVFQKIEDHNNRLAEIINLLIRFDLLNAHYVSDIERLASLREAGGFFSVLEAQSCPTCGASPDHHDASAVCHADVELVVAAADAEMEKTESRLAELETTIAALKVEAKSIRAALPRLGTRFSELSREIKTIIAPDLRSQRTNYKDLADTGAKLREALGLFSSLSELEDRKAEIQRSNENTDSDQPSSSRLTHTLVSSFSKLVEDILVKWGFPDARQVHFDPTAKDLVIAGKARTSYGKGLRAITQSAFSIALMEYCNHNDLPHPGIVVLDSPLLSYREPDGTDDDLSETNLNENFYMYLLGLRPNQQVIIVENTDPPSNIELGDRAIHFSGMDHEGRFGLFPTGG